MTIGRTLTGVAGVTMLSAGMALASAGGAQAADCSPHSCVVESSDTLSSIGTQTGFTWVELHRLNAATIGPNPGAISPGQVLALPDNHDASSGFSPSEDTVVVGPGQSLSEIASIMGVSTQALYEANAAQIGSDPDLVHPGMVLTLPRTCTPIAPGVPCV